MPISFAGGRDLRNVLSTTEIFEQGSFKAGPVIPAPVYNHCMIRINETHSILTGGYQHTAESHVRTNVTDTNIPQRYLKFKGYPYT